MPNYKYRAFDSAGRIIDASIEAANKSAAMELG